MKTAILLIGAAVVLAVPVLAHADSHDDQFLAAVHAQDIGGDSDQLIGFAHTMCGVVGTPGAIGPMMGLGLPMPQAYSVAVDGVRVYCPEKNSLLPLGQLPSP
jgi:hypothetical protein